MSRIIKPNQNIIEQIRSNKEFEYALKHYLDGLQLIGKWKCDHYRAGKLLSGGWEPTHNIFTTEGIARLLNIIFHDISKAASNIWYVGLFKNNVTPAAGDTASAKLGSTGAYGECQNSADFDEADDGTTSAGAGEKPGYTTVDTTTATITNAAAKAHFVMNASITVYGAFLSDVASTSTPGSAYLMAAKRFATSRAVIADDELSVTYEISVTSS